MSSLITDYRYDLPEKLIASQPVEPRDQSRMLVLNRENGAISHQSFQNFPDILEKNSLLVVNNTGVIPAQLPAKRETGGALELLLLEEVEKGIWKTIIKRAKRLKEGEIFSICDGNLKARFLSKEEDAIYLIEFLEKENLLQTLQKYGYAPIPPYIRKMRTKDAKNQRTREEDLKDYQTAFAQEYGAVAAPTAGLHFTPEILEEIKARGIELVEVTLHVGLGTFEPIRVDDFKSHKMHTERYIISEEAADKINQAKKEGRKIVSIGTTSARALESAGQNGVLKAGVSSTDIFIYPPYKFKIVDQLLTNFHLPESTLMLIVAALSSKEKIMKAYKEAVKEEYRFYSYGDCMFIR